MCEYSLVAKSKRHPLRVWLEGQNGKTQVWLAEQLGISTSFLSEILSGDATPSLQLAVDIENLTGIPARELAAA